MIFWVPPALLLSYHASARLAHGWAALGWIWLVLAAVMSSGALGTAGLLLWLWGLWHGEADPGLAVSTAVAASAIIWSAMSR